MSRRSLSIQMLASLVFWITLVLTLSAAINAWVYRSRSIVKLEREIALEAQQLETAIAWALWQYDTGQIQKVLDGVMNNPIIAGVRLSSEGRRYDRSRTPDWLPSSSPPAAGDLEKGVVSVSRTVTYMEKDLGRVTLWATTQFLDREITEAALYFAGTMVLLDLVLILSLYTTISRAVITPLKQLEAFALSARRGDAEVPEPSRAFTGEMEVLRRSMAEMLEELKRRYSDVQKEVRRFRDSEERFRILVNTIPDFIWLKDPEGVFLSCNKMFCSLLKAEPKDVIGRTDYDFWSDSLAEFFREKDRRVLDGGQVQNNEERMPGPDGNDIILDTIKAPVHDAAGKLIGVLGIARDITARHQAEEERTKLQDQLNQAQKIESIGRLAGGVAHDFNNMLGVIRGNAELALAETGLPSQAKEYIHEIGLATDRSADLTRQLLAFARKEEVAPRQISLNQAMAGMLKMLRRLIGEDIELQWAPGEEIWSVKMDPSQLDHILVNLCINARDAILEEGRISIETRNIQIDPGFCEDHPGARPGEFVMLVVGDNGTGIPKEVLPNIFDPFFTTKSGGKGTGLGLSTVYGVVRQNGGFTTVYSEPGLGSVFHIYLPRYEGDEILRSEGETGEDTRRGTETILLVEDEASILLMVRTLLEKQGYTVLATESPVEAITFAGSHNGRIDLLITDVIMPRINGKDLSVIIKKDRPGIKVVFMSGYTADMIDKSHIDEMDARFIQKPFSNKDLLKKVREILG